MRDNKVLYVVIVVGEVIATLPFTLNTIDNYLYTWEQETHTSLAETLQGIIILKDSVTSSGSDTLIVTPGAVWVLAGGEFKLTIKVLLRHTQPCPYNDWRIEYSINGDLQIVNETPGELVDPKTYVKELTIRVNGNGTITITFYYGSECPYGDKEEVTVEVYTGNQPQQTTIVSQPINTTTTSPESEEYVNITGIISNIDYGSGVIYVDNTPVYVRGEWVVAGNENIV